MNTDNQPAAGDALEAADKALIAAEVERWEALYAALAREDKRHNLRHSNRCAFGDWTPPCAHWRTFPEKLYELAGRLVLRRRALEEAIAKLEKAGRG